MEKEATDKFRTWQKHSTLASVWIRGSDGKADGFRGDGAQAMIGEADAVGVSAKVTKKWFRSSEGTFGVDDPAFLAKGLVEGSQGRRVPKAQVV